ncbi:enoyl-CoA hydratase [Agrobacterium tumefaciens]|nr:enoyl-CoA hydratase [Agrobacterium tumefaciens]
MQNTPSLTDARLEIDGRIATLMLNRDDVRNELTGTNLIDDITATVEWINRDETVSVLVLSGEGSAFSAGGNIKQMLARDGAFGGDVYEVQRKYRLGIQRIALAMNALEVPSIAAVNGAAIGAGFDLACMCDLRLAASGAKLGETFINVGIIPGDGGSWFLQRLVGYQRAAELTFSGRVFDADEALRLGIVLEVIDRSLLMPRAMELAATLAAKPPQVLRLTKRLMKMAQRAELADVLELSAVYQGMAHNTQDHLEALSATLEKRTPNFEGR